MFSVLNPESKRLKWAGRGQTRRHIVTAFFTCWARSSASFRAFSLSLKIVKKRDSEKKKKHNEKNPRTTFQSELTFLKKCFAKENLKSMGDGASSLGKRLVLCMNKNTHRSESSMLPRNFIFEPPEVHVSSGRSGAIHWEFSLQGWI